MNQKAILIAAVVIALLGLGGYYVAVKNYNPGPSGDLNMLPQDETANWKTYTNDKYGFEFQYPPSFSLSDRGVANGFVVSLHDGSINDIERRHSITIFAVSADNAVTFQDYLVKHPVNDANSNRPIAFKTRALGSNTFYFARTERFEGVLAFDYYILHGNSVLRFKTVSRGVAWSDPNLDEENDVGHVFLRQILATLKFTKPTPTIINKTANWKTCVNAKYRYEVKYPSDWRVWTPGAGEARSATCEENLAVIIFSPNIYGSPNASQINIDVSDKARLDGTIYAGATSIEDYFARNPSILQARPKIKETTINGEKLIWLKDNTMLVFHDSSLFEIRAINIDDATLNNFLSTFKFIN